MQSRQIRQGDPVPLSVQLDASDTALFPRAFVYFGGTLQATVDLSHVANGYYEATSYNMPAQNSIKAQYRVYTDSGHTTLSTIYNAGLDEFGLDNSSTQSSVDSIPTNPLLTNDARLDNLDATISSRASQVSVDGLNDLDASDVQGALTAQGYTTARAGNLDNLDATVSTRATQVSVNALNDLSQSDVQTALTAQGYTAARAPNLDNLNATVSSRSTQASVDAIPTNPLLTNDARLDNLDATVSSRSSHTPGAIWDVVNASHLTAGSTGKALDDAAQGGGGGGGGNTPQEIRDAVWDAQASGHTGAGTTGLALNRIFLEGAKRAADLSADFQTNSIQGEINE